MIIGQQQRDVSPDRKRRRGVPGPDLALAVLLCVLLVLPSTAHANWLTKIVGAAERAGARTASHGAGALDNVATHIRTLPAKAEGTVLAAQATPEGHWRFVNKSGETLTAGTPEEMKRVVPLLVPDAKPDARLTLYLTEDTIFSQRAALKDLPRGTELNVLAGEESYRLLKRGEGAAERLFAEVRPNLVLELTDRAQFAEAVWQLARPLNKANIRILALEPGSAPRLLSTPRIDPSSKKALIDSIDPVSLPAALGAVRGQTVLVTGRIDGKLLHFKPSSGPDRSLLIADLFKAAEDADVNLIVLHASSTPRQPGGRNWLWQKVEVKGLDDAMQRARVADFYNALAAPSGRLAVTAKPAGPLRTVLEIGPAADLPKAPTSRPIGDILADAVSDLTGRVVTSNIQANVRSGERQRELDQRLLPGIPSDIQLAYFALIVIGLLGVPVSRAWWGKIWPPENRAEYAGSTGYWAARLIRGSLFLLVFLPVTAPASAPFALGRQIWELVMAPVRACRWLAAKLRRRPSDQGGRADDDALSAGGTSMQARTSLRGANLGSYRPSR